MRGSIETEKESQPLTVIVAARLDVRQWGRLKYMCARANLSMSDAIRRAIDSGTNESMTDDATEEIVKKKIEELSMKRKNKKGHINVQS
jgi:K+-transporting ATPase c subunit